MGPFFLLLAAAAGQTASPTVTAPAAPPPTPPPVDCTDSDHRAFDFWIGDWDVSQTGSDTVIAHSKIEKIVNCAISENYNQFMGPKGKAIDYHGRSISSYVPIDKGWQQFYVDTGGTAATLKGGVVNGEMVFTSTVGPVTNRMTLNKNSDGSVRQHGETTTDGKTWSTGYDFTYRPRKS